jgi:DNA-binding MarR family transcriptional regulator
MAVLEQEPLQNNQIARRIGITQEHCCRVIRSMIQEGLLLSEFHAPRRVNRLSPVGRQIAERISEAKNISANLTRNE